jgi:hypothetical protein
MKNEEHYTRVEIEEVDKTSPDLKKIDWWRTLWITLTLIFFFPFLPTRHKHRYRGEDNFPKTATEYFHQLEPVLIIATVIGLYFIWQLVIKPSLNRRKGYRLRGQFEVIGKNNHFGQTKLKLQPGTNHSIQVDRQFYKFINIGDKILVERSVLGDIVRVRKV